MWIKKIHNYNPFGEKNWKIQSLFNIYIYIYIYICFYITEKTCILDGKNFKNETLSINIIMFIFFKMFWCNTYY
ncbi:hypothetical protein ACMBCM_06535, partial [Spiroplasma sp. K1]